MSHSSGHTTRDEVPLNFLFENSAFLIAGTIAALVWAHFSPHTHHNFFHYPLRNMFVEAYDNHGHKIYTDSEGRQGAAAEEHAAKAHAAEKNAAGHSQPEAGPPVHGPSEKGASEKGASEKGASEKGASEKGASENNDSDAGDSHSHSTDNHSANTSSEPKPEAGHEHDEHSANADHQVEDPEQLENRGHPLSLSFIINDLLMAVFFAIATKEVWEAMLPGGSLSNPRKAALPLIATCGGVFGPALVFLLGALFCGWNMYAKGWAVPCATDIAFSYLVARLIFGSTHPAIAFLLLLAIADDAIGLAIIAVFYPQGPLQLQWVLLTLAAMILTYTMRKCRIHSFWWYLLIPGAMAWFSFYKSGIHAALGLVPIIPLMPHAQTDLGVFAKEELERNDTLNEFEHWWKRPVELFLGLFGLCNAAVPLTGVGAGTWLVLAGLLIGKPVGITLCTMAGEKFFNLKLPEGMDYKQVVTVGMVAAIGFTVALFVSTSAFMDSPDEVKNSVKMGALLSFGAAVVAFITAKCLGVKPWRGGAPVD